MDEVLGEFLRGQLMVMMIMGLVYGLGLMLVGLDSGFAIGYDCRYFWYLFRIWVHLPAFCWQQLPRFCNMAHGRAC